MSAERLVKAIEATYGITLPPQAVAKVGQRCQEKPQQAEFLVDYLERGVARRAAQK